MNAKKLKLSFVGCVAAAMAACGAEKTYVGTDGAWTTAENWNPAGAPVAGDVAKFTANATISGGVELPAGRVDISVASGKTLTISGVVSGEGGFVATGEGGILLKGNNTFAGDAVVSNGYVYARSEHALGLVGEGSGKVEVVAWKKSPTPTLYAGGVTIDKKLVLRNASDKNMGYSSFFVCDANTTNLVTGELSAPGEYLRMCANAKSKWIIAGGGSTGGYSAFLNRKDYAEIVVTNKPITIHYQYGNSYEGSMNGWLTLSVAGNYVYDNSTPKQGDIYGNRRTTVDGAFRADSYFNQSRCTLDLCGTKQIVNRVFCRNPETDDGVVTGTAGASLTMTQGGLYTNTCTFKGAVDLVISNATDKVLALTGRSTSTGTLTLDKGRKNVALLGGWSGDVTLRDDASLVTYGAWAFAQTTHLTLGKNAKVTLADGNYLVAGVTVDGEAVVPGYYAKSADGETKAADWIDGDGVVYVAPAIGGEGKTWYWTGAASSFASKAANWTNAQGVAELPDFTNGTATLEFGADSAEIIVDCPILVRRVVRRASAAGQLNVYNPDGVTNFLTFAHGSISVTGAVKCANILNLSLPVRYVGSLSADVLQKGRLLFWDSLHTVGEADFTKVGFGDLYLKGEANRIYGDVVVSNGNTHVYGSDPLGGEGEFRQYPVDGTTKTYLHGATVRRDFYTQNPGDNCSVTLFAYEGTTNEITGHVTNGDNHLRVEAQRNARLVLSGGVSPKSYFIASGVGSTSEVVVKDLPIDNGRMVYDDDPDSSVFCYDVNDVYSRDWFICNVLKIGRDNAITHAGNNIWFGKDCACTLDLDGHEISVSTVYRRDYNRAWVPTNSAGQVTSIGPRTVKGGSGSVLKLIGSGSQQFGPLFKEAASLVRAGTGTTRIYEACTSTGTVEVAGGTLVFQPCGGWIYNGVTQGETIAAGSWLGCPSVTVSGGSLQLLHGKAFGAKTDFHLDGGVTTLAADTSCRYLYVNGIKQKRGWYGKAELGALVSGDGRFHVCGDRSGTVAVVR